MEDRWGRQLETILQNWESTPEEAKRSKVRMAQNYDRNTEAEQPALSLLPPEKLKRTKDKMNKKRRKT